MRISLNGADLVILASSHNPSIMSPEWLEKYEIVNEEPKQFVHTRDFSLFESESYSLIIDQQRMQVSLRTPSKEKLRSMAEIGAKYIQLLHHIPYQAIGINFLLHKIAEQGEILPKIRVAIGGIDDLPHAIEGHELRLGCIIQANKDPYVLRLIIEPQNESILSYSFNYHHVLKDDVANRAIEYIYNIDNLYRNSEELAGKLA